MTTATDFEKLGVFYLGRPWDLATRKPTPGLVLYDSKDLVTHAVCVGMTGSGKTGLCLALLEEAAIDGIPALVIDPKGDLADLMLTFPELRPEDSCPGSTRTTRAKGLEPADYARQQAELWRKGLAEWGQDGARIQRLRDAVDIAIYTPGSEAGCRSRSSSPSRHRPRQSATTASSSRAHRGHGDEPARPPRHRRRPDPEPRAHLIATILDAAWRAGRDLDLAHSSSAIQTPPVARVGVLDLESFYPSKARFDLAMGLNNLLAAPGFAAWMQGEPLDVGRMLCDAGGQAADRHLLDRAPERRGAHVLRLAPPEPDAGWMRSQSGTTSLRAIVYMDEIFGYFPPVANPPSKLPLLTLLKQARAFGVGLVLATQNPVDLDYKGLANTGTWFIGRLQTERDKARVLEGLEGAAAGAGNRFDRGRMEEILAGLGNRIFLMNNVRDDGPEVFESRWAMS